MFRPSDSAAIIRFSHASDVLFVAHLNKRDGRHADDLVEVDGPESKPLQSSQKIAPAPNKKPFGQLGFALEFGDFFGRKAGGAHPLELIDGGKAPRADVRDGNNQSGCGFGRRLAETQLGNRAQWVARRNPEESIRLAIEARRSEPSGLQKFVAQRGRDFDGGRTRG